MDCNSIKFNGYFRSYQDDNTFILAETCLVIEFFIHLNRSLPQ